MRTKFTYAGIGLLVVFLATSAPYAHGQNSTLKGKIVDSQTQRPVPFATIKVVLRQGATGCITNADGDFQLPAEYFTMADTLIISCIGYQTKKLLTSVLTADKVNVIALAAAAYSLPEVVVEGGKRRKISAARIIQLAIKNIANNYPVTPQSYIAYYRDYQRREDQYLNLNEAIVEVFDPGFNSNDQLDTHIALYAYKQNVDFARDSASEIPYDYENGNKFIPGALLHSFGGNELAVLRVHDAIRNNRIFSYSFVNKLHDNFLLNHTFTLEGVIQSTEVELFHITFITKPGITDAAHFAKGSIFVERNNFAIHKLEYATYERKGEKENMLYTVRVEYARHDKRMKMNYISFHNVFQIKDPYEFKATDIVYDHRIKAIIVKFNNKPDVSTLQDPKNYYFTWGEKPISIDRIEYRARYDSQVFVFLKKFLWAQGNTTRTDFGLRAEITGVKDINGKEINSPTFHSLSQFREIFIQQQTTRPALADSLCIDKNRSLRKNPVRTYGDDRADDYWMNTPLKVNLD